MTVDIPVRDSDAHIIENSNEIFEYLEEPYRSAQWLRSQSLFPTGDGFNRSAIGARQGIHKSEPINPQTTLAFLDEVGIETTVLYPSRGLSFSYIQDPSWAVSVAHAYNDWFADRYHKTSPRLRGAALIPLQNVPEAVAEMERAFKQLGAPIVMLPANGGDLGVRRPLGHPDFWPVYEKAESLNCPIAIHGGPSAGLGLNAFTRLGATQALEHPFALMIQFTSMVTEGVFERFPKLRVAFLEAGTGWVSYLVDRLDRLHDVYPDGKYDEFSQWVKKKPSEYVSNGQIFFSCEGSERGLGPAIECVGDEVLLYASDFPHEVNVQRAKEEIREWFEREDLSEQTRRNILCDNYGRLYQQ